MGRRRLSASLVAMMLAMQAGGCGGGDDGTDVTASPTPSGSPPPSSTSELPPAFVQCMADRGFQVESSDDIHAAPQEVLQTCFGALHEGGG